MSGQAPPWAGTAPAEERTPDGRPIVRTPHGPHVDRGDGHLVPYRTPEEEWSRTFGRSSRRGQPIVAGTGWSPWTSYS